MKVIRASTIMTHLLPITVPGSSLLAATALMRCALNMAMLTYHTMHVTIFRAIHTTPMYIFIFRALQSLA